jgi:hypothetical protein
MALLLANVALSDTFNTWRVRTNQIIADAASTSNTTTFAANVGFSGFVTTSLIPSANVTLDLGSAGNAWRDLYLSGNTIFLGDATISTGDNRVIISVAGSEIFNAQAGGAGSFDGEITAPTVTANSLVTTSISSATGSFTGQITAPTVTANSFVGPLSGTATTATTVTLVATNSTDATHFPIFVDAATGNENPRTDTGLTYNPSSGTLTSTDFNATSDILYKDQIAPIDNALDIINQLEGKMFNWKHTNKKSYGVIAQQVEQILPDIVTTNENGKSVNYNTLIAILIESNKQLSKKIKLLEEKL